LNGTNEKENRSKIYAEITFRTINRVGMEFKFNDLRREALRILGGDFDTGDLRKYVKGLVRDGLLHEGDKKDSYLASHKLIEELLKTLGQSSLDEFIQTTLGVEVETIDEILEKYERFYDISLPQFYALMENFGVDVARLIRDVALNTDFFERNPVDLLMEFLLDCVDLHNDLLSRFSSETASKRKDALANAMHRFRNIIRAVFDRYLQIPVGNYRSAVIYIPDDNTYRAIEITDREVLEKYLRKRVVDDRVIKEFDPNRGQIFFGIDSSSLEIKPKIRRKVPGFRVFTTVSVSLPDSDGGNGAPTIRPTPDEIAYDNLSLLERKGYVIKGSDLLHFDEYYIDRIAETQMQRLMYGASLDILNNLNETSDAVYLDGRVWPTEHKLSDLFAIHGKYVKQTILEFSNLVKAYNPDLPPVIGVVKRGHLGFLWYLVFWYAYRSRLVESSVFILEPDLYESLENKDGAIAWWLLVLYYLSTGKYGRLFAVRRKLYASDSETMRIAAVVAKYMGKNLIEVEEDFQFWNKTSREMVVRKTLRTKIDELTRYLEGYQDAGIELPKEWLESLGNTTSSVRKKLLDELKKTGLYSSKCEVIKKHLGFDPVGKEEKSLFVPLSNVYAFSDVVSFYYMPPRNFNREWLELFASDGARFEPGEMPMISLPRMDLLLPVQYWTLLEMEVDSKELSEYIDASLFSSEKVELYTWYDSSEGIRWNLIVPSPVKLAHIYSKSLNKKEVAPMYAAIVSALIYRELTTLGEE